MEFVILNEMYINIYPIVLQDTYIGNKNGDPFTGKVPVIIIIKGSEKNIPNKIILMIAAFFLSKSRSILGESSQAKTPPIALATGSPASSFSDKPK